MLALRGRHSIESIQDVWLDDDLRVKCADGCCQRHNVDDRGRAVEDSLGRHEDGWMSEASLAPFPRAEIKIDDITRGRH